MTLVLNLSSDQEAELHRLATVAGTDIETVVLDAIRERLEVSKESPRAAKMPYEQWRAEFEAWIASHGPGNPHMDDSRESIYD